jgi:hypothetical protein
VRTTYTARTGSIGRLKYYALRFTRASPESFFRFVWRYRPLRFETEGIAEGSEGEVIGWYTDEPERVLVQLWDGELRHILVEALERADAQSCSGLLPGPLGAPADDRVETMPYSTASAAVMK